LSIQQKKMFEQSRHVTYLECGDMSPHSKRGRVRALQSQRQI